MPIDILSIPKIISDRLLANANGGYILLAALEQTNGRPTKGLVSSVLRGVGL
jgi:hypothetical protein